MKENEHVLELSLMIIVYLSVFQNKKQREMHVWGMEEKQVLLEYVLLDEGYSYI